MGPSMKEKLSRYFFYFMLYSIMGWSTMSFWKW